jgi:hypothetical protein
MSLGVIARFSTVGEAESARSALEAAGIDCVLADDEIVAIDWLYSNAVGGVKLVVRDEDREQARNILETPSAEPDGIDSDPPDVAPLDAESAEATELPPEEQDETHCPACGSSEATRTPRMLLFLFLAVVLCGVGLAVGQVQIGVTAVMVVALILAMAPTRQCTACGERWSATGQSTEAPSPAFSDTVEERCPRCGSTEFHRIDYRRLKAITLLSSVTLLVVLPVWMFLPKQHCDQCGMSV